MRFSLVAYDDEAVVFDAASGDTHYLTPLCYAVLRCLDAHAEPDVQALRLSLATEFDLADFDLAEFDPEGTPDLDRHLDEALSRLRKIGLLSPA